MLTGRRATRVAERGVWPAGRRLARPRAAGRPLARLLVGGLLLLAVACGGGAEGVGAAVDPPATSAPPPVRIMIVGDSITHESAGDYTWRYRLAKHLERTAPGRVDFVGDRADLWDNVADVGGSLDYPDPDFDREHHARWGISIKDQLDLGDVLRRIPADVILFAAGANDLSYYTNPPDTIAVLRRVIDTARAANPDITFIVGHVLTRADFSTNEFNLPGAPEFNKLLDATAPSWSTAASRVLVARTDEGWNPFVHAWDGSHPTPDGEVLIARGFADALAGLGIGEPYGPVASGISWPGTGRAPTAVPDGPTRVRLAWPATPGATQYIVEQRSVSAGERTFARAPASVAGYQWTSGELPPGVTMAYRVVPAKGRMIGKPGPEVVITVGFPAPVAAGAAGAGGVPGG
ncbi:MAG: GDSL family lipase [Frankia sp.]|nr:GDSL family lipase [Frankia sp.]